MTKWEYINLPLVVDREVYTNTKYYQNGVLKLDGIGAKGWELVTIYNGLAFFKRPLDPMKDFLRGEQIVAVTESWNPNYREEDWYKGDGYYYWADQDKTWAIGPYDREDEALAAKEGSATWRKLNDE